MNKNFEKKMKKLIQANKEKFLVLYVGRLTKGKGVGLLIDACKKVYKKNKRFLLFMAGKKTSFELPEEPFICYFGALSFSKVNVLYKYSHFIAVPSLVSEPFGRTPLEAALFKKPVVAAKSGGLKETVKNNFNGVIVERNNVIGLAKAIEKLIKENKLREKMGKNNFKFVSNQFNLIKGKGDWNEAVNSNTMF